MEIMKKTFLGHSRPMLTVMVQDADPNEVIRKIRNGIKQGAEAFGITIQYLKPEYQTQEIYRQLLQETKDIPSYVTNYRTQNNTEKSDDELAQGLIELADMGYTLIDVMGDLYGRHEEELTDNPQAIQKQEELIRNLHGKGAQVLMSSHLYKFAPAERVLEIALEQKRRGADVIKIVTGADTMEQQLENLRITHLLKQKLGAPFLFLSVGAECDVHRKLGMRLGCCMSLNTTEHDAYSTPAQPLLSVMKSIRDDFNI
jgi:3-dehydroquinate dehydratase